MQDEWVVHPIDDNHWQAWKGETLMQDNIASANEAWEWIDRYINPVEAFVPGGFKVKGVVR